MRGRFLHLGASLLLGASSVLSIHPALGYAQSAGAVSGTVTIAGAAEGVPGVRIGLAGRDTVRVTDDQGRFGFPAVPAGRHELRADFVGCRPGSWTIDVPAGGSITLDLQLHGPAVATGPLVRAGVAAGTPDAELPFTVERLTRAEIERNPGRSVADLIRGAFPGVKVVQGSGLPGTAPSIQLRGATSISLDHSPLVVVDGMPTGGGLVDLDPLDIESIEVLKGSAASALYGARGEPGVIVIETRNGTADSARCVLRSEPST